MTIFHLTIIATIIITIIIGIIAGKFVKGNTSNYMIAGKKLGFLFVALAIVSQAIDGNATMGNTGLAQDFGFWAGAVLPIGLAISIFILGAFFAKKLNSSNALTLIDIFEARYQRKVSFMAAIIALFGFGILLAGNVALGALLAQTFFAIKYESAVIVICLAVCLYCFRGGIISDIWSDIFQMFVLVASMVGVSIYLVINYDILNNFFSTFQAAAGSAQMFTISGGGLINWASLIALGFGNIIAIDFVQRIFAARSPKAAQRGCYLAGFLTLLIGIPFSLLAISLAQINAGNDTALTFFDFTQTILPPWLGALLISGVICAALSTVDGAILSMSNILTRNILNIKPELETQEPQQAEQTALYFLRLSTIPIACCAMIFAILLPSPGILLSVAFDLTFAGLLIPFIFALFWPNFSNNQAALYAMIVGIGSRAFFATLTPTAFGLTNPFYITNNFFPASLDGLGTMIAPLLALATYLIIAFGSKITKKYIYGTK